MPMETIEPGRCIEVAGVRIWCPAKASRPVEIYWEAVVARPDKASLRDAAKHIEKETGLLSTIPPG